MMFLVASCVALSACTHYGMNTEITKIKYCNNKEYSDMLCVYNQRYNLEINNVLCNLDACDLQIQHMLNQMQSDDELALRTRSLRASLTQLRPQIEVLSSDDGDEAEGVDSIEEMLQTILAIKGTLNDIIAVNKLQEDINTYTQQKQDEETDGFLFGIISFFHDK